MYKTSVRGNVLILLDVLGTVIFLTIGYAQFTTQLGIYGISATVRVHKDVRIGGISLSNATNDGISHYEEYNVKDIYSSVTLPNANSSITYNVKVLNLGNVEMGILNISGLPNNLTYSISNYNLEDPLCDDNDSSQCKLGVEKTLHITISYKKNGFDENNITYPLDLTFDSKKRDKAREVGFKLFDATEKLKWIKEGKEGFTLDQIIKELTEAQKMLDPIMDKYNYSKLPGRN